MTQAIVTMAASLAHAAWTKEPAKIGGGVFDAAECREAARALEAFPAMLERLRELVAFVGIMCGSGPDCIMPEHIDTPLGVPVKIGAMFREAQAAIAAATGEG